MSLHPGFCENKSKKYKRSIYFVRNMKAGDVITEECIRCIRPGFGLEPKYFEKIMGMKLTKAISVGDRVSWDILSL